MNKDIYILLIYKQLKGEISPEEKQQLVIWLAEDSKHQEIEKNITSDWEKSQHYNSDVSVDLEKEFSFLKERIAADQEDTTNNKIVKLKPNRTKWLVAAASIALLIFAGIGLWNWNPSNVDGLFVETKTNEEKMVTLSDGTKIWLNQNSRLDYPINFSNPQRIVQLKGEAFFEVAHNPEKPFIVETANTNTTVLGTSFNLKESTENKLTEVMLYTGKVRFENKEKKQIVALHPGQRATYHNQQKKMDPPKNGNPNINSWKSKVLEFRDVPLEQVFQDLSQHFKVDISYLANTMKTCRFNGRYADPILSNILKDISKMYQTKIVEIAKDQFEVQGGTCLIK